MSCPVYSVVCSSQGPVTVSGSEQDPARATLYSLKNDTGSLLSYDINFYLEWNRNGRQAFCSRQEITPEEWIHILEQLSATTSSGGVTAQAHSMVHAMIQARPDLFLSGVMKG